MWSPIKGWGRQDDDGGFAGCGDSGEGQAGLGRGPGPTGSLTFSLGHDPDKLPVSIHEVLLGEVEPDVALLETPEGMTLLPANIDLAGAEAMLLMRAGREYALKRALSKIGGEYDVVIVDCPPSLGVLTLNGLTAADDVIVPLQLRDAGAPRRRAVPAHDRRRAADHQRRVETARRPADAL